jgi:mono/diheme cytochrome c family protein
MSNCALCHGPDGKGGPLAVAKNLPSPDLTTLAARETANEPS